jgi:uncharacterized protein
MEFDQVRLGLPDGYQLILGQSHFIKTAEDLYEALVTSSPGIKFGVAFCEASGKALIRQEGTDPECTELATDCALRVSAGHCFVVVLKGAFPINVLARIRAVEEVVALHCATANPVTVVVAASNEGRGVLGVIDGVAPKGVETGTDLEERRAFLRKIGYKK